MGNIIVFGEKLENYLFEIVKISNALKTEMYFLKRKILSRIQPDDIIITDNISVQKIPTTLQNKVITVTFSPRYKKTLSDEKIISVSEIPSIVHMFSKKSSFPIVEDKKSKQIFSLALKIAKSDATVLISGATGTGKEILAKYIHENSSRRQKKFVSINCAAIPENLLESELFGYEKGSFSGAFQQRIGKFEEADGGTILLDEISEMPLFLQAKLLRVLQEREISRLGGNGNIKIDVRIIATTNRNLEKEVEKGTFREDLYYRLNVVSIISPKLNERPKDIRPLANYFCNKYSQGKNFLSEDYLKMLEKRQWRGNIRELENAIHSAVVLSDSSEIKGTLTTEPQETLKNMEKKMILESLERNQGKKNLVSRELNIPARTLRYKLAEYRKKAAEK